MHPTALILGTLAIAGDWSLCRTGLPTILGLVFIAAAALDLIRHKSNAQH
jgi:hypothetical protein